MKQPLIAIVLIAATALSACSKPDEAALARGDAAFAGQTVGGQLQPVVSRPVMVGQAGDTADACGSLAAPKAGALSVRWSPDAASPEKAEVSGGVAVCQTDSGWTGIVFPAFGQEIDECYVSSPVDSPREYQGPCRWGWVETDKLGVIAG